MPTLDKLGYALCEITSSLKAANEQLPKGMEIIGYTEGKLVCDRCDIDTKVYYVRFDKPLVWGKMCVHNMRLCHTCVEIVADAEREWQSGPF